MNERIAKLEVRADVVEKQLDRIVAKLDSIDEKVGKLPTREFFILVGIILAAALAFAALTK